jgi:hypothetical protein
MLRQSTQFISISLTQANVQLLKGHVAQVSALAFSRDGSFLAAGSVV